MPHTFGIQRQGFTMVEILAVVVVMSIIASLLVAAAVGARRKADRDAAEAGVSYIAAKIDAYFDKRGQMPPDLDESGDTTEAEIYTTLDQWNFSVLPSKQQDPWGNAYIIVLGREYGVNFPLFSGWTVDGSCYEKGNAPFCYIKDLYAALGDMPKDILDQDRAGSPPFNDQLNGFQVISAGPDGRVSRNGDDEVNADNHVNW